MTPSQLALDARDLALNADRHKTLAAFAVAWNARDVAALMDCMAEDCAFHASSGPDPDGIRHAGRAAVEAAYAAIFAAFPKAHWAQHETLLLGDRALMSWRFIGTRVDGTEVEVDGCDILVFDEDRIALKDSYRKAKG